MVSRAPRFLALGFERAHSARRSPRRIAALPEALPGECAIERKSDPTARHLPQISLLCGPSVSQFSGGSPVYSAIASVHANRCERQRAGCRPRFASMGWGGAVVRQPLSAFRAEIAAGGQREPSLVEPQSSDGSDSLPALRVMHTVVIAPSSNDYLLAPSRPYQDLQTTGKFPQPASKRFV